MKLRRLAASAAAGAVLAGGGAVLTAAPAAAASSVIFESSTYNRSSFDCYVKKSANSGSWLKIDDGESRKITTSYIYKCDASWKLHTFGYTTGTLKKNQAYSCKGIPVKLGWVVALQT